MTVFSKQQLESYCNLWTDLLKQFSTDEIYDRLRRSVHWSTIEKNNFTGKSTYERHVSRIKDHLAGKIPLEERHKKKIVVLKDILEHCFVEKSKNGKYKYEQNGRPRLKDFKAITCVYIIHYWHWADKQFDRGAVAQGRLIIKGDWDSANLVYETDRNRTIDYEGSITTRLLHNNQQNYYLHLSENLGSDSERKPNQFFITLCVKTHNVEPLLWGSFSTADINEGYPLTGKILLAHDRLPIEQLSSIKSFAGINLQFATNIIRHSAYEQMTELPGYLGWEENKNLFNKVLHGYFFKATKNETYIEHFTLETDQSGRMILHYDHSRRSDDEGFFTIEKGEGGYTFLGNFNYKHELDRFLYQILMTAVNDGWYIGAIMGLSHNQQQILLGRLVLHQNPIPEDLLQEDKLGELLMKYPLITRFLLELDDTVPSETLALYRRLGWPHLPEKHLFKFHYEDIANDYYCYALIRKERTETYLIARYPLQILLDGRVRMKYTKYFGTPQASDIVYHGKAFYDEEACRLHLYFDKREERNNLTSFHLTIYFRVKPNERISKTYGISNRYINDWPEARMEVLVQHISCYSESYEEYSYLNPDDINKLKTNETGIIEYLSGRINRSIIPFTNLQANPNEGEFLQTRQDEFRQLHLYAALHAIAQKEPLKRCLKLLNDAYLHGFGTAPKDIPYLQKEIKKPLLEVALHDKPSIHEKIKQLWPKAFE